MKVFSKMAARLMLIVLALLIIAACDSDSSSDSSYSAESDYAIVDTGQTECYDDMGELSICPAVGESGYVSHRPRPPERCDSNLQLRTFGTDSTLAFY